MRVYGFIGVLAMCVHCLYERATNRVFAFRSVYQRAVERDCVLMTKRFCDYYIIRDLIYYCDIVDKFCLAGIRTFRK